MKTFTESLWSTSSEPAVYPPLVGNAESEREEPVDVAIIGGGITGLTAALLLSAQQQHKKKVVLVEARRLGSGVSHRSTSHLTEAIDTRYFEIEKNFGVEGARLAAQSSRAAIQKVEEIITSLDIASSCGFIRRPGYLFTEKEEDIATLAKEFEAAGRAGLRLERSPSAPLPFRTRAALRFSNQAQFHIQRYLNSVAAAAQSKGVSIHENSRVIAIEDGDPCTVHLENGATIRAKNVFVATHAPLNRVFLQTKIAAYRSYVLAYPNIQIENGLFWDTEDPYHYFSSYEVDGVPYLVIGGADHKTGTVRETTECFEALDRWTKARIPSAVVATPLEAAYQWSAQVEEPVDGLPFIGRNSMSTHVFVATGFSGNGTTFGTIAAMIFNDIIAGVKNPWADLYAATRAPTRSLGSYVTENIDFPAHLISDHVHPPDVKSVDEIPKGEGKTVRVKGSRLAVYRDEQGALHAVSSVCTHLGCTVKWNTAERTWDCPCHGSRFSVNGDVLDGPAARPLAKKPL